MGKIELGTIQFTTEFKGGKLQYGSPRMEVLQDNMRELESQVPDGKYKWTLTLDLEKSEKVKE